MLVYVCSLPVSLSSFTYKEYLVNNTYTLPNSTFYTNSTYATITLELDEVLRVYKNGHQLLIDKPNNRTIVVRYNDEFEVDLIIADLTNRLKDYRAQSV